MGRRKDFTEAEKATIMKEIAKGKTTKSIAERINRHVVTVTNFFKILQRGNLVLITALENQCQSGI
jgi:DNA-binding NarL/FixJ family response regulator